MIDTHAHLDEEPYREDLDAFIAQQRAGGVETILVPGVDASSVDDVWNVCARYPGYLYPAIGLHPENVKEDWEEQLNMLHARLLSTINAQLPTQYIAIGEIGLDYHFDTTYKDAQHEAFRRQLAWAEELDLPVMIHVRDATEDALTILREQVNKKALPFREGTGEGPLRGVMHCWSGSEEVAQQLVQMGLYLGIGGIITFKNCKLREHLNSIPLDRIVLETDSPYMAPVPHRGERNESQWMSYVAAALSDIYHCTAEEVIATTSANAKTLFRLDI